MHQYSTAIQLLLLLPSVFAKVRIVVLIGISKTSGHGSYANLHQVAETNERYEYLLDDTSTFASRSDVRLAFNEDGFQSAVDRTVGYGLSDEANKKANESPESIANNEVVDWTANTHVKTSANK